MEYNVQQYFKHKKIVPKDIKYLLRENPHTLIYLFDGRIIKTTIPLKVILEYLPKDDFINICKGIALRKNQIVHITDEGLYTMTDGSVFQGRKRNPSQHKKIRKALIPDSLLNNTSHMPLDLLKKCTLMDDMPLAFCVIELVFDSAGHGMDFLFRYCNQEMEQVEGVPLEQMVDHSFYEVFENGDKKWLVVYADVALNGTKRTIHDFSPEIGISLTVHCYQPAPGYCACILIPT